MEATRQKCSMCARRHANRQSSEEAQMRFRTPVQTLSIGTHPPKACLPSSQQPASFVTRQVIEQLISCTFEKKRCIRHERS